MRRRFDRRPTPSSRTCCACVFIAMTHKERRTPCIKKSLKKYDLGKENNKKEMMRDDAKASTFFEWSISSHSLSHIAKFDTIWFAIISREPVFMVSWLKLRLIQVLREEGQPLIVSIA